MTFLISGVIEMFEEKFIHRQVNKTISVIALEVFCREFFLDYDSFRIAIELRGWNITKYSVDENVSVCATN
jgi:hypothetical protein